MGSSTERGHQVGEQGKDKARITTQNCQLRDQHFSPAWIKTTRSPSLIHHHVRRGKKMHSGRGLPRGLRGKESTCNAGDKGSIPGSGRSPGGGHGNPLQYSCLQNPMNSGAWRATDHGSQRVGHSEATEHTHTHPGRS